MDGSVELTQTAVASVTEVGRPDRGVEELVTASPDQIARFVVLETLGSGGMGVVYAAWDPELDRRVALKLVRPDRGGEDAHGRLLREAQAMARVSHPNVVQVFDVGTHEGSVWIAMEFVEGSTLRTWLVERTREWSEILAMFRQAGRGLEAAHQAGLVHRDFKPDNVLIGQDGRARVADFGLVRPIEGGETETHETGEHGEEPAGDFELEPASRPDDRTLRTGRMSALSSGLSAPLTRAGAILGTPRFMAPEQFLRQPAKAAADQFAFCVALYQSLFGFTPFRGGRFLELAAAVTLGEARTPPRDSAVPALVTRAVLRGLSREAGDRFADMGALLSALEVVERRRRWPELVASLVVAGVGVGMVAYTLIPEPELNDPCSQGREQMNATWGQARREGVHDAFSGLGLDYGEASFFALAAGLDQWSAAWGDSYEAACTTRHEQSSTLYDARMGCLAGQRAQVDELVELLTHADVDLVRRAPELEESLPELARCEDLQALGSVTAPPEEQAGEVEAVRAEIARLSSRLRVRPQTDAQSQVAVLRERADATGYIPLSAELGEVEAEVAAAEFQDEAAITIAAEAFSLALAAHHDLVALDLAIALSEYEDHAAAGPAGRTIADRWHTVARGLAHRLGLPPAAEVRRRSARARQLSRYSFYDEALIESAAGLEISESIFGADDLRTARARLSHAQVLIEAGRAREAEELSSLAMVIFERSLGPDHPSVVWPLKVRAGISAQEGRHVDAIADLERGKIIYERTYPADHPGMLDLLRELAMLHDMLGHHQRAREGFEEVLERGGEAERVSTRDGAIMANSLCFTLYRLGELSEAERVCQIARVGAETTYGEREIPVAIVLNNFALIARAQGDATAGLALDREALGICEERLGTDHPYVAYSLIGMGEGLLALGRHAAAIDPLQRALEIRERTKGDRGELGEAQWLLARALWGARSREREPALELARSALVELDAGGMAWERSAQSCRSWLADR